MTSTYEIEPSPRKGKKLRVTFRHEGRDIHIDFGQKGYQDYTQHDDKKRRESYLRRSAGIKDKNGRLTKDNPLSPNFWARRILWDSREPIRLS